MQKFENVDILLKWNPRFQFAKVNPCFGILLQE